MNARLFLALLAAGVVVTVTGALAKSYTTNRRLAREHAAYRAGRGR